MNVFLERFRGTNDLKTCNQVAVHLIPREFEQCLAICLVGSSGCFGRHSLKVAFDGKRKLPGQENNDINGWDVELSGDCQNDCVDDIHYINVHVTLK